MSPFSLCYHCTAKRYNALLSPTDFCRELLSSLALNTQQQHDLNQDVRTYRRHHVITSAFRADIHHICDRLIDFDLDTLGKQRAIQQRLGMTGIGLQNEAPQHPPTASTGSGKFSFSSIRRVDAVDDIKEGDGGGMKDEEEEEDEEKEVKPSPGLNVTITMTTPPSCPHRTTRPSSTRPPPHPTRPNGVADGSHSDGLLFPPQRRIHSEGDSEHREVSTSHGSTDSQSDFMFPAFHEDDETHTPTPLRRRGDDHDGDGLSDDDDDVDEAQPGAAPERLPLTVVPSAAQSGPQLLRMMLSNSTPETPIEGGGASPQLSTTTFLTRSYSHVAERDLIHSNRKSEKALFALCLMYAKAATEPAPLGVRDSETLRRKQHALRLLLHVLHHSRLYFRQHVSSSLLLRRLIFPPSWRRR